MASNIRDEPFSIAALGRSFRLGTLYDCRSDTIMQGITLWDKSTLDEKSVRPHETADFGIVASDSINVKSSALDASAGLKLSFLGGLISLSGSGNYLNDRKSSNQQERVTLKYKCTVRTEEMTMEQLGKGNIEHPEVFDHGTATHVVTGITYGGNAFFVFDRELSSSSQTTEVGGSLEMHINKIPFMNISGKGEVSLSEEDKNEVRNFSCTYFGDFKPTKNPSTFEEAVRLYKEISSFAGENGENAVPIKVYLYPLSSIDSRASRLVRDISTHLVTETAKALEEIYEFDVRCNDLIKSSPVQKFRGIRSKIQAFKSLLQTYKLEFQSELSQLLPDIRGGGKQESMLADLLKKKETSPFSSNDLESWLEKKEGEVKILSQYTTSFSEIKFASKPGDLEALVLSPNFSQGVLCFLFRLPKCNHYLEQLEKYNSERQYANVSLIREDRRLIPYTKKDDEATMMEKARLFKNFFEANKDNSSTVFIVAEDLSDSDDFQADIIYYVNGSLNQDFEIPEPPRNVTVVQEKITHESILVRWTKPLYGASSVKKYKVICETANGNDQSISHCDDLDANKIHIRGLDAGCEYQVSIQSVCDPGVSHQSEVINQVKTRPTSPPGKPMVSQISSTSVEVKWSKPSTIGAECAILKYVVKQQKGADCSEMELESDVDCTLACVIEPGVVYRFKVYCDCGHFGKSLNSELSDDFSSDNIKFAEEFDIPKYLVSQYTNTCLTVISGSGVHDAVITMDKCNDEVKQQWFVKNGQYQWGGNRSLCLTGSKSNGKLGLAHCSSFKEPWKHDGLNRLCLGSHCLDISWERKEVYLSSNRHDDVNQKWWTLSRLNGQKACNCQVERAFTMVLKAGEIIPFTASKMPYEYLVSQDTLTCLTVLSGTHPGNAIIGLSSFSGSRNQQWIVNGNQWLWERNRSYCLGSDLEQRGKLKLEYANRSSITWWFDHNGVMRNKWLALDVPKHSPRTHVCVYRTHGEKHQKWWRLAAVQSNIKAKQEKLIIQEP